MLFEISEIFGWGLALPVSFVLPAALIIAHKRDNRIGWLMLLPALSGLWSMVIGDLSVAPTVLTPAIWLRVLFSNWSWIPVFFPIFLIPLHFPTGHPPSPRWAWVNRLALAMGLIFVLLVAFSETVASVNGGWALPNPIGLVLPLQGSFLLLWFGGLMTILVASVSSLFVRYRRARTHERQRIKWLLYAGVWFAVVYMLVWMLRNIDTELARGWRSLSLCLSIMTIPAAIGYAILHHKLYDIDIIIRRTLVYSVLTGILAAVYFGVVILTQQLFQAVTGETPDIAIVLSTLLIVALFNPLRHRIQDVIDRRLYRRKYDVEQTLAQFNHTMRDEVDVETLKSNLIEVIHDTMQPDKIALWVRESTAP